MNKNQTAVQWLTEKIQLAQPNLKMDSLVRAALEMEEEQKRDYWQQGWNDAHSLTHEMHKQGINIRQKNEQSK